MKIRIKSPPCTGCVWGQREDDELIYCFRADVCARIREGRESEGFLFGVCAALHEILYKASNA